jgi:hypothetical protein
MARSTAAKAPDKKSGSRQKGGGGGIVATLAVIVFTVLGVTATPLCILLVAGLLPTGAAALIDRHRSRYLARAVGAMNLAGIFPAALRLWEAGLTFSALHATLASPYTWLAMYGAAGIGWLLHLGMPPVVRVLVDYRADEMKHRLEARAKTLVEEWGEEVTGRARERQ